jgi:hypothetical protein
MDMIPFIFAASMLVNSAPIEQKPETYCDFWVGSWTMTGKNRTAPGKDEFTKTDCENTITKTQGGQVVHENFKMPGFTGESWSVYDARKKKWFQTWVDAGGSYLTFVGEKTPDGFMFVQNNIPKEIAEKGLAMRMVFSEIKKDSFLWRWQRSDNSGKTWEDQWTLNYKRKK